MFQEEERTEHSGVPPAKDRIKNYKCRSIKRTIPSAAAPTQIVQRNNFIQGSKSQADFKMIPSTTKEGTRPITAGIMSNFGQSEAPTAISGATQSIAASNNRAISVCRFSKFEEVEKSVKSHPFKVFFTSNEPTEYHKENRFEGKSNY